MRSHVKNVVTQTRAARALLRPVLASHLHLRTRLCVYKTYVRTRLTYAAPAWYALLSETDRKSLRAQQSLALRTIAGAPRFVRNAVISRDLRMESLDDHVRRLSTSMFARADGAQAQHLRGIAPYHRRPPDKLGLPRDLTT
ncbi:uncharacterized protein LOC123874637 [Maniola jurtina]|uniref:uncharacterized protein LOC123874637 n=1 Tax=Maniola jurtina TaxID=191418 RepID=UPI001E6888E8|nr:uncharacterized protein LOC123874637 [Maniola jurtina]